MTREALKQDAEEGYKRAVLDHFRVWLDRRTPSRALTEAYLKFTKFRISPDELFRRTSPTKTKGVRETVSGELF